MKLRIGCSGWQYPEWKRKFYPKDLPTSHWFEYYASQFNTVEINYSHYHNITEKNLQKWYQQAPTHFRYSIKVHRLMTHYKRMHNTKNLLRIFYKKLDILGEKLGCVLFQFPKHFTYTEKNLQNILSQLDLKKTNVVEFRHDSWWREDVIKIFQQTGVIFCSLDAPKLSRELIVTNRTCYIRFHGKHFWYMGNYSTKDLKSWLRQLAEKHVNHAWVYFNNDVMARAPMNALELIRLLKT
jgi:uncharacterized protein YecE (DUF72 family)